MLFSAAQLLNSQLVCLPPVRISNLIMFIWIFCLFSFVHLLTCTCEFTAVLPSCTALSIPAFSINIIQITVIVLCCARSASVRFHTSHQCAHFQWRPQPQTNKVRSNTGNINLYFNIIKLKSVYQTISYNNICSCLKFSFLSLLIMSKANWFGNQQLAMLTWLMRFQFQYCFRVQFLASNTTSTSRHGYMF